MTADLFTPVWDDDDILAVPADHVAVPDADRPVPVDGDGYDWEVPS